ncbi:hypothetical protein CHRY9390_02327 [Chryseobacterium aquaeductus]|uniref:DUF3575 domain-containing protein n=1 Tax=Chryseobacterium aquaeductus TaxID=2675056 RepID=A0A9N8MGZ4_9FLAO|nr:DUF3575 domain-containing protein [Chryseobacterium aquaeductus]CAA7331614.1 hypothetical protein CHRY9390_02327 [Chryseobacterium potabilaquae]CAD7811260.1 hypothetical protein CHRY9390_02327 [Chryseobacterium aquaeductus]
MKYTMQWFPKTMIAVFSFFLLKINAQTELKFNVLFLPLGTVNIAAEKSLSKKISLQAEAFVSPWKSFGGKNFQIYMGTLEGRYYFKEMMRGWYVGAYGSIAAYNLQKWNYFKAKPVFNEDGTPQLLPDGNIRTTERYQKGLAFIFGISGGYHFIINNKLGLDVYAGVGTTQSIYRGYFKDNDQRYDKADEWNKSGEFIPTRGGLMFTYKLN